MKNRPPIIIEPQAQKKLNPSLNVTHEHDNDRNLQLSCMSQLSSNATLKYSQAWKSECNCDSMTMRISDILRSTVWRDSWTSDNILFSLLFLEDKISTMSQRNF